MWSLCEDNFGEKDSEWPWKLHPLYAGPRLWQVRALISLTIYHLTSFTTADPIHPPGFCLDVLLRICHIGHRHPWGHVNKAKIAVIRSQLTQRRITEEATCCFYRFNTLRVKFPGEKWAPAPLWVLVCVLWRWLHLLMCGGSVQVKPGAKLSLFYPPFSSRASLNPDSPRMSGAPRKTTCYLGAFWLLAALKLTVWHNCGFKSENGAAEKSRLFWCSLNIGNDGWTSSFQPKHITQAWGRANFFHEDIVCCGAERIVDAMLEFSRGVNEAFADDPVAPPSSPTGLFFLHQ